MDWFINVNGENYGPFTLEDMERMIQENRIIRDTLVYNETLGQWVEAATVEALGFAPVEEAANGNIPYNQVQDQKATIKAKNIPKKKGHGCLISILVFVLIIVLAIGGIVLTAEGYIFKEKQMDLARSEEWVKDKIEPSGGTVLVNDPASPVNGLNIQIPQDAYSETTDFKISTQDIKSHKYGENVTPITPVIKVENGGEYSDLPMNVSIPIDINDDEFAMAFYYNDDGSLEALPTVSLSKTEITIETRHFSNFIVSKINKTLLKDVEIDTGFRPGVDDWSFTNYGSQASPGGFCLGASVSAAYYYYEYKSAGAVPLRQYLDNNHGASTPEMWFDDSMGIRLASTLQEEANSSGWYMKFLYRQVHRDEIISDDYLFMGFAYAMLVTRDPQVMGIYIRDDNGGKVTLQSGHAIVAYRVGPEGIYVSDPNKIGQSGLFVPFDGTDFGIYSSSSSANRPPKNYNSFALVTKSALIDWNRVRALFDEALKDPDESTIGNQHFARAGIEVSIMNKKQDLVYADYNEVIEIKPEDKGEMKKEIENYIEAVGFDSNMYPADWDDRDYVLVEVNCDAQGSNYAVYRGSNLEPIASDIIITGEDAIALVPIDAGMNNIGILIQQTTTSKQDDFIDFYRISIKNGEADLTGQWEGKLYITNDEKAKKYLKKVFEPVIRAILEWWGGIIDKVYTEAEIQEILEENLDFKKQFEDGIPFGIIVSDKNEDEYKVKIFMQFGDEPLEYETEAKFKRGVLEFDFAAYQGLKFYFDLDLYDNETLDGNFEVSWLLLRNFLQGKGRLIKQ